MILSWQRYNVMYLFEKFSLLKKCTLMYKITHNQNTIGFIRLHDASNIHFSHFQLKSIFVTE